MAVLNKHHHGGKVPDGAIDIMRGTRFGNPFRIVPGTMDRADVIVLYRRHLWRRLKTEPAFREAVAELHGKDVCCCCAPLACHGDVLLAAAAYLRGPG